jgi:Zn finger protein HypA/HybF involved in hydrogenase expression
MPDNNPTNSEEQPVDLRYTTPSLNVKREGGDSVIITIGNTQYRVTERDTKRLCSSLSSVVDDIKSDFSHSPVLMVARNESGVRIDKNPYHIKGEFGCHHASKASEGARQLNLVEMSNEAEYDKGLRNWYGTADEDTERLQIPRYIEIAMCSDCLKPLRYWHKQRRIFLPDLADSLALNSITSDSFTDQEQNTGRCDTCGTPRSAISILTQEATRLDQTDRFILCPTCRDLLVEAENSLKIKRLQVKDHPHNTGSYTVTEPIPDPDFTPSTDQAPSPSTERIASLSQGVFVNIVKEFDEVSEGRAKKLYNNGYHGIPALANSTRSDFTSLSLIGKATATAIIEGAEVFIQAYGEVPADSKPLSDDDLIQLSKETSR